MCLSTVYKNNVAEENMLARNVADIRVQDGKVVLTDLMGIRTELDAMLDRIDLMENYIILK